MCEKCEFVKDNETQVFLVLILIFLGGIVGISTICDKIESIFVSLWHLCVVSLSAERPCKRSTAKLVPTNQEGHLVSYIQYPRCDVSEHLTLFRLILFQPIM